MGVPLDRGLTLIETLFLRICFPVEMGVPLDRGLTQRSWTTNTLAHLLQVEMGVPLDRGLTHFIISRVYGYVVVEMGVPLDRGLTQTIAVVRFLPNPYS